MLQNHFFQMLPDADSETAKIPAKILAKISSNGQGEAVKSLRGTVIEATTQLHHGTPSNSRDAESATTAENPAQDLAEPQESGHGDGGLIEPSFGPCETATACATANNPAEPLISEHLDGDGVGCCLAVEATPLEAAVDTN
jgi:hypothetical protein